MIREGCCVCCCSCLWGSCITSVLGNSAQKGVGWCGVNSDRRHYRLLFLCLDVIWIKDKRNGQTVRATTVRATAPTRSNVVTNCCPPDDPTGPHDDEPRHVGHRKQAVDDHLVGIRLCHCRCCFRGSWDLWGTVVLRRGKQHQKGNRQLHNEKAVGVVGYPFVFPLRRRGTGGACCYEAVSCRIQRCAAMLVPVNAANHYLVRAWGSAECCLPGYFIFGFQHERH